MKEYSTEQIRNIVLIGHGASGKTMLAEAILVGGKAVSKMGSVDHGSTVMDWDSFEIDRKSSVNLSVASAQLKDVKLNLIDTPGFPDFLGDVISGLAVAETSVTVVCAASGLQVQTLQTWDYAIKAGLSKTIFINKMDRENADFDKVLEALKERFGADKIVPITMPIGSQTTFKGIVDLVVMEAFIEGKKAAIPEDLKEKAALLRATLMENIAGNDENLMNKFLDSGELTSEDIMKGIKKSIADNTIIPVLCGSAVKEMGIQQLINFIVSSCPAPANKGMKLESAVIFKTFVDPFLGKLSYFKVIAGQLTAESAHKNNRTNTTEKGKIATIFGKKVEEIQNCVCGDIATFLKVENTKAGDIIGETNEKKILFPKPCYAIALEVETKGTEDKLATGLHKLVENDPIMYFKRDSETHQTLLFGMGDTQTALVLKKLERDYKVKIVEVEIIVPYRETITKKGHGDFRHKKQSGGAGQFAHVILDMEPMNRSENFEFLNEIVGGAIPKNFIPAVEKGVKEAMENGSLAGFPVVDIRIRVVDGKYHDVDSNEISFKIAGRGAFRMAQKLANPILLEPIYEMAVIIPDEYTGDVMGDLNQRRGRVEGLESLGNSLTRIKAHAPYSEILKYMIDLKALTQGRGTFEMTFSKYEVAPAQFQSKIIEKYGKHAAVEEE
ncbi:MAG: hypothetical protein A2293_12600 [Elusimicrobia bacterium RIFOXYB2_FULL_49_7]|nr:MAG: hypothetical protein A2293_12600 [Elusimicrobia bacterium RIFOXYB2_FULL_49_7]